MTKPFKILFLCTGNSARSILGEYLIRKVSPNKFESFSAGAHPSGKVNPLIIRFLQEEYGIDASDARSKSWSEYKDTIFDFVITVCDHARETCPVWPGKPVVAHWGLPDPAFFQGTDEEKLRQIAEVARIMKRRLELFNSLPLAELEKLKLSNAVTEIGEK